MTRRFYRPHHALLMLLDHGVRTVDRIGSPYTMERLCDLIRSKAEVRCYVTEGQQAFELRANELVSYRSQEETRYSLVDDRQDQHDGRIRLEGGIALEKERLRLIARDGKPFHWPEREAS